MEGRIMIRGWCLVTILACVTLGPARAGFTLVDDFEPLELGPVDGQGMWSAEDTTANVALDPAMLTNQVLAVGAESAHLFRDLLIPDGTTRMLFLRFRYAERLNATWGPSGEWDPYFLDQFDVEMGIDDEGGDLRIADDGDIDVLATLQPDRWYNCWVLVDHDADQVRLWLHSRGGDSANSGDQLSVGGRSEFLFGNLEAGDLSGFHVKTGECSGLTGLLYIDDIYLEETDARNLENPSLPPPTGATTLGSAANVWSCVSPNPFSRQVDIDFMAPGHGDPTLSAFDAMGRLLTDLPVDRMGQRDGHSTWNGCDADGRRVVAGVYYLRLMVGPAVWTRRIVRID